LTVTSSRFRYHDLRGLYFADAITEDLTTDLSRLANMFVISRNTAFTFTAHGPGGIQHAYILTEMTFLS